jgi:hypothetical protein
MNAITDLLENLRDNLVSALGIFLIVVILIGYLAFSFTSILPQWRQRTELIPQVSIAEGEVTRAAQSGNNNIDALRTQIQTAPTRLVETASSFLVPDAREAQILDNIYQYAEANGVTVAGLQIQTAPNNIEDALVTVRQFKIDVSGPLPQLILFLAAIKETQQPGFVLTNIRINQQEPTDFLTMDVLLYTSPLVDPDLASTFTVANGNEAPLVSSTPQSEADSSTNNRLYEVRRGDTLLSVSLQHSVTLSALKAANQLSENTIFPGQELVIP